MTPFYGERVYIRFFRYIVKKKMVPVGCLLRFSEDLGEKPAT